MKQLLATFVWSLILLSDNAFAKKQFLYLGGGGEPTNATGTDGKIIQGTMFDDNLKDVSSFLDDNPSWEKEVAFNGGHPKTEAILKKDFPDSSTSFFTNENYLKIIDKYTEQLQNGSLKKGDQLLIQVDTHGSMKGEKEETHSISTSFKAIKNYGVFEANESVSLDALKNLKNLAKEKGVKVAIIDLSCHSGNTLKLADDNTCVISGTGPEHYGYYNELAFSRKFPQFLSKGKNLEEVFLETRRHSLDPSFPMISAPEGLAVQEEIYKMITPFLYYYDESLNKLSSFTSGPNNQLTCYYDKNFKNLQKIITELENIKIINHDVYLFNWKSTIKDVDLKNLKHALAEYYVYQKALLTDVMILRNKLSQKENFIVELNGKKNESSATWGELMFTNYDFLTKIMNERIEKETSEDMKILLKMNIMLLEQAKQRMTKIAKAHPELPELFKKLEISKEKEEKTKIMASNVGYYAHLLYDNLYKNLKKSEKFKDSPNPCKDFVL